MTDQNERLAEFEKAMSELSAASCAYSTSEWYEEAFAAVRTLFTDLLGELDDKTQISSELADEIAHQNRQDQSKRAMPAVTSGA